ncbi:MAG: ABC transporter substrate-binding protein [Acetobacteraceae bacterium]|nr:ABC transporter substrate-binding protein [Acetobacteraceae bacterium]
MHLLFRRVALWAVAIVVLSTLVAAPVRAADVIVLTVGAFKPVLLDLTAGYEAASRDTVAVSNDTAGGVSARVARGEEIDLVILSVPRLEALAAQGQIVAGTVVALAKSGIGVVVRQGSVRPDISTVEAFKRAMLAVPSFAYIDPSVTGSSGAYLAQLFERLGIAAELKRKAVLVPGGLTASRVDNGEAAMALQQISDLRAVRGVMFVGPLPAEIQHYTVYGGGIPTKARRPAAGKALLAYLQTEAAILALTVRGLEKP